MGLASDMSLRRPNGGGCRDGGHGNAHQKRLRIETGSQKGKLIRCFALVLPGDFGLILKTYCSGELLFRQYLV